MDPQKRQRLTRIRDQIESWGTVALMCLVFIPLLAIAFGGLLYIIITAAFGRAGYGY